MSSRDLVPTAQATAQALQAFKDAHFSQAALEARAIQVNGFGSRIRLNPDQDNVKVSSSDKAIWNLLIPAA